MTANQTAAGRRIAAELRDLSREPLRIEVRSASRPSMVDLRVVDAAGTAAEVSSQAPSGPVLVRVGDRTEPIGAAGPKGPRYIHLTPGEIAEGILRILAEASASTSGGRSVLIPGENTNHRRNHVVR